MTINIKLGTHIQTDRLSVKHHGISLDGGLVIDNSAARSGVAVCTLQDFAPSGQIEVVREPTDILEAQRIIQNAYALLGKSYNALTFNCEHFANLCRTGSPQSDQVAIGVLTAALTLIMSELPAGKRVVFALTLTFIGVYVFGKLTEPEAKVYLRPEIPS